MAGIRISGAAFIETISPPFSDFEGTSGDGDVNVYRRHREDLSGDATMYTSYADGGTTIEGIHNPVLSPDRTKIAYTGVPSATNLGELWVVANVPGSTPTMLVSDDDSWINTPMWSPDSSTIVYTRGNAAGNIYGGIVETVAATGGTPTVLYTPSGSDRAYRPAYSYDGTKIAFIKSITGNDQLWVMDADGTNAASIDTIVEYRLDGSQFGWGNLGNYLAYDNGATPSVIYVINADGTGKLQIDAGVTTGSSMRCGKFCWTASDSVVVIASNQGLGYWSIYSLDPGAGGETLLEATHGSANQAWMKQAHVYNGRVWFIEVASSGGGGTLSSIAATGSNYVEELDVNDATLLDDFTGGTGFEYQ